MLTKLQKAPYHTFIRYDKSSLRCISKKKNGLFEYVREPLDIFANTLELRKSNKKRYTLSPTDCQKCSEMGVSSG